MSKDKENLEEKETLEISDLQFLDILVTDYSDYPEILHKVKAILTINRFFMPQIDIFHLLKLKSNIMIY